MPLQVALEGAVELVLRDQHKRHGRQPQREQQQVERSRQRAGPQVLPRKLEHVHKHGLRRGTQAQRLGLRQSALHPRIVGGDHQRGLRLLGAVAQQGQRPVTGRVVQARGGLVHQQHLRPQQQGPRQGHALGLSARQLRGLLGGPSAEMSSAAKHIGDGRAVHRLTAGEVGQRQVVGHAQRFAQQQLLRQEADAALPASGLARRPAAPATD